MKQIVIILTILFARQTHAFSNHEFCTELVAQNNKKTEKISFNNISRIMFRPKSIIQPQQVHEVENAIEERARTGKIVYVHLPKVEYDKNLLKSLQKSERKIIRLKLFKKLKKTTTVDHCLDEIDSNKESFVLIRKHLDLAIQLEDEIKRRKDFFGLKDLKTKLKSFERKGWQIVFSTNIVNFLKDIQLKMPREILLIAHSDENGKLYDAEKNIFPKSTFHHLNQFVNHFILFSCHAEKVISYHELKKVFEKKTLTYPLVQDEFKTLFDEKTPLISVKSMLNLSYFMQNENNRSEVCDVKINSSSKEINLIISLNDFIIGSMHDESRKIFQTDCKMIGDKNTVKIFQPTSAKKMRLNITEITVSRNNEETQLDIKEFISKINQHHILTIGTTGGIP